MIADWCNKTNRQERRNPPFVCTKPKGHLGDHCAHLGGNRDNEVMSRWKNNANYKRIFKIIFKSFAIAVGILITLNIIFKFL